MKSNVIFSPITLSKPGVYKFTIRELGGPHGWITDKTAYTVIVTVAEDFSVHIEYPYGFPIFVNKRCKKRPCCCIPCCCIGHCCRPNHCCCCCIKHCHCTKPCCDSDTCFNSQSCCNLKSRPCLKNNALYCCLLYCTLCNR